MYNRNIKKNILNKIKIINRKNNIKINLILIEIIKKIKFENKKLNAFIILFYILFINK